jgi:hypothetical protein
MQQHGNEQWAPLAPGKIHEARPWQEPGEPPGGAVKKAGLAHHVALSGEDGSGGLPYADALRNFYAAARYGLDATIVWPRAGAITADVLLLERLIPKAREGLADLGVDDGDGNARPSRRVGAMCTN